MKKAITYSILGDTDYHVLSLMSIHSLVDNCKDFDIDIIVFLADMSYEPLFKNFPDYVRIRCEPMPRLTSIPSYLELDYIKKHVDLKYNTVFAKETIDSEYHKFMNGYYQVCDSQFLGGLQRVNDYDKIICLDIDTIIQCDINKLFNTTLEHPYYPEYNKVFMARPYQTHTDNEVNAGVIMIDCKQYRLYSELNKMMHFNDWYKQLDADPVDIECDNRMLKTINWGECYLRDTSVAYMMAALPKIWNDFPIQTEKYSDFTVNQRIFYRKCLSESNIIHYTHGAKPWNSVNIRRDHSYLLTMKNWVRVFMRHKHRYPELSAKFLFNIKENFDLESFLDKGKDIQGLIV